MSLHGYTNPADPKTGPRMQELIKNFVVIILKKMLLIPRAVDLGQFKHDNIALDKSFFPTRNVLFLFLHENMLKVFIRIASAMQF